jgi:phosphoheptose isomerase
VLAPAEVEGLGFSGFKFDGRAVSGLMASITKGLVGAQSAGAPVIVFAGFNGNRIRGLLGNVRFGHEKFSW